MDRSFLEAQGLASEVIDAVMAEHDREVADVRFAGVLESAIAAGGGRSAKAITALLDLEALKASEDPRAAIAGALTALKQESGYLFDTPAPPPYAPGTGTGGFRQPEPQTLAEALKERFQR